MRTCHICRHSLCCIACIDLRLSVWITKWLRHVFIAVESSRMCDVCAAMEIERFTFLGNHIIHILLISLLADVAAVQLRFFTFTRTSRRPSSAFEMCAHCALKLLHFPYKYIARRLEENCSHLCQVPDSAWSPFRFTSNSICQPKRKFRTHSSARFLWFILHHVWIFRTVH